MKGVKPVHRVLLAAVLLAGFVTTAAAPAAGEGCRIVMPITQCDTCKNACCESYNSDMQMCQIIRFLCWLEFDFECAGFTLCKMQAEENLERCEMLCEADYGDCW